MCMCASAITCECSGPLRLTLWASQSALAARGVVLHLGDCWDRWVRWAKVECHQNIWKGGRRVFGFVVASPTKGVTGLSTQGGIVLGRLLGQVGDIILWNDVEYVVCVLSFDGGRCNVLGEENEQGQVGHTMLWNDVEYVMCVF
jgi:hypothetical protein